MIARTLDVPAGSLFTDIQDPTEAKLAEATGTEPWETVVLDHETVEKLRRLLFPQHAHTPNARPRKRTDGRSRRGGENGRPAHIHRRCRTVSSASGPSTRRSPAMTNIFPNEAPEPEPEHDRRPRQPGARSRGRSDRGRRVGPPGTRVGDEVSEPAHLFQNEDELRLADARRFVEAMWSPGWHSLGIDFTQSGDDFTHVGTFDTPDAWLAAAREYVLGDVHVWMRVNAMADRPRSCGGNLDITASRVLSMDLDHQSPLGAHKSESLPTEDEVAPVPTPSANSDPTAVFTPAGDANHTGGSRTTSAPRNANSCCTGWRRRSSTSSRVSVCR